jgi:hypothetical protein
MSIFAALIQYLTLSQTAVEIKAFIEVQMAAHFFHANGRPIGTAIYLPHPTSGPSMDHSPPMASLLSDEPRNTNKARTGTAASGSVQNGYATAVGTVAPVTAHIPTLYSTTATPAMNFYAPAPHGPLGTVPYYPPYTPYYAPPLPSQAYAHNPYPPPPPSYIRRDSKS